MTPTAKALEVLNEAKAVAFSLGLNYFYLDMGEFENISFSKAQALHQSLGRLVAVIESYNALTDEERRSIDKKMPFMISA